MFVIFVSLLLLSMSVHAEEAALSPRTTCILLGDQQSHTTQHLSKKPTRAWKLLLGKGSSSVCPLGLKPYEQYALETTLLPHNILVRLSEGEPTPAETDMIYHNQETPLIVDAPGCSMILHTRLKGLSETYETEDDFETAIKGILKYRTMRRLISGDREYRLLHGEFTQKELELITAIIKDKRARLKVEQKKSDLSI